MAEPRHKVSLSDEVRSAVSFALGGLAGAALLKIVQVIRGQSAKSSLEADAFLAHLGEYEDVQREALIIAGENLLYGEETRTLQNGEKKLVLNAGMRNFREPWARDFGFASYGLLAIKEFKATRETLEAFFAYQKDDGQFPIKVHSTNVLVRSLYSIVNRPQPTHSPLRPRYISGHKSLSPDGNALLVSAAVNYARQSLDELFLRTCWPQLKLAIYWLEGLAQDEDGLIAQGPYSDWADTIARSGKILYTNVVYWKALDDMATAAKEFGFKADQAHFASRAAQLSKAVQAHFWREELGYFVTSKQFENLNASGNLLAISWGCTTLEQSHRILDKMADMGLDHPVPTKPVNFGYPKKFIALEARLGGFPHYHISAAWLWLGSWHIIALVHLGRLEEAKELLNRLAEVIVRDKVVYEVYEDSGKPFSNFFYTSEAPLTWSAGMIIHAFSYYHRHLH